eukprot:1147830-Pelagomonas_calceolata.AAC.2
MPSIGGSHWEALSNARGQTASDISPVHEVSRKAYKVCNGTQPSARVGREDMAYKGFTRGLQWWPTARDSG